MTPADLAAARREAEEALRDEENCECGPTYCPHVVAAIDALAALLAATEPAPALPEEAEAIINSVAEHDCRCGLWFEGVYCDPCRARAFLAARGGRS